MATWYSQGSGLWSTLSNWNDAANGSGSAPGNIAAFDDSPVVIQAGHVVEFDVEDAVACDGSVSGWTTGIAGITITGAAAGNTPGELTLTDTANNADRVYGLRLKANTAIVGTNVAVLGKVTGGTESVPLPTGAVHIIQFVDPPTTGGFDLTYLSLALYAAQPVETAYVTTAAAGIGDSVLSVEGRLTSCNPNTDTTEWQVGRAVRVIRTTSAGVDTQATTIAAVGDGTITLSDNLTVAKPAGSLVVLEQRNIEIRDSAVTSNDRNIIASGTGAVLDCAIRSLRSATDGTRGIYGGTSHTVQGSAVISGCTYGIYGGTSHTVQGSAVISGCTRGIIYGTSHTVQGSATISGCTYGIGLGTSHTVQGSATISGCTYGVIYSTSNIVQGAAVISGCTYGINSGTSNIVQGAAVISGCTYGINRSANVYVADTATISSNTTHYRVDDGNSSVFSYATPADGTLVFSAYKLNVAPAVATPRVEIWPTGYEAAGTGDVTRRYPSTYIYGEYPRTWCNGGKSQSQTSVLPTGHTVGGQMIFEQHADIVTAGNKALYCWNWVAVPVTVGANQRARITVNLRKDTSFAGYTETPMVQVVDALYDGTDIDTTYVQTSSMTDNQDTWQTKTFTVSDPGLFFVRILGRHDTGNLYYTVTIGYEYDRGGGGQTKPARGWRITDGPYDDIYRGIEGLWLFNEGSGTIVADASGHGRHGVASSSAPWAPSPSGGMWRNNSGTFRQVDVGGPTATWFPLAEFTMVMSVMVVQAPNSSVGFMGLNQAGPLRAAYIAWSTGGPTEHRYRVGIYSDTGASAAPAGLTDIPPVGTMTSVALVYRGTSCELWLQGQLANQNTLSGTRFASSAITSPLWLGAWTHGTTPISGWYNAIDWAALWSRALSAQEVRRLHEQPPWMVG